VEKGKKAWKIIGIGFVSLIVVLGGGFLGYCADYYHAEDLGESLSSSANVAVIQEDQEILFDPRRPKAGLVFYPGAKVEFTAYAGFCHRLAEEGFYVVLLHMPFNLAFFDANAGKSIPSSHPEITSWYLAGHSLGGAMAASYIATDVSSWSGLILFASYSTVDLSGSGLKTFTFYGSEDRVMNRSNYESNKVHLPSDNLETIIDGANHDGWGNYGVQRGDGEALISGEEQQSIAVQILSETLL
jgi:hypothetical protein